MKMFFVGFHILGIDTLSTINVPFQITHSSPPHILIKKTSLLFLK